MHVVIVMRMTEFGPRFSVPFEGTHSECAKRVVGLKRQHAAEVESGACVISYARVERRTPARAAQ